MRPDNCPVCNSVLRGSLEEQIEEGKGYPGVCEWAKGMGAVIQPPELFAHMRDHTKRAKGKQAEKPVRVAREQPPEYVPSEVDFQRIREKYGITEDSSAVDATKKLLSVVISQKLLIIAERQQRQIEGEPVVGVDGEIRSLKSLFDSAMAIVSLKGVRNQTPSHALDVEAALTPAEAIQLFDIGDME